MGAICKILEDLLANSGGPPAAGTSEMAALPTSAEAYARALQTFGAPAASLRAFSTVWHLETGGGTSGAWRVARAPAGVHAAGAPNAYWKGATYKTADGELLRSYATVGDGIRDFLRLVHARYPAAWSAAIAGNHNAVFDELEAGGYSSPGYAAKLRSRYKSIYG